MSDYFKELYKLHPDLIMPYIMGEGSEGGYTFYNYIPINNYLAVIKQIEDDNKLILGGMLSFRDNNNHILAEGSNWSCGYEVSPYISSIEAELKKARDFYNKLLPMFEASPNKDYYIELAVKE